MGHSPAAIARITCPIGLPGITGKDPATIAVAVAAALLEVMSEPKGRDATWTDERGTSEEGRQRLEAARRRAK
jgi:xanthine dehydrogenase accessory factor